MWQIVEHFANIIKPKPHISEYCAWILKKNLKNQFLFVGGLTMAKIVRIAATRIQALYRSYRIRKSFAEHKHLLLRHEKLRKQKNSKKNFKKVQDAGSFLGHVIEETHNHCSWIQKLILISWKYLNKSLFPLKML